jgi:predicted nucleic acid-binding protein
MAGLVVLDASFLIALWKDREIHHAWAIDQLGELAADEFVTPALTLAEVLVRPVLEGTVERLLENISTLGVKVLEMKSEAAQGLATTRSATGLKMPDALVVHEALTLSGQLATSDRTLKIRAEGLGIKVISPFA